MQPYGLERKEKKNPESSVKWWVGGGSSGTCGPNLCNIGLFSSL